MKTVHLLIAFLLAAAPAMAQGAFLGVQVSPAEGGGVQLESVNPDTAAEIMGLKPGDRLLSLDGRAVIGVPDFVKGIGQRLPGEIVRFELIRGGETLSLRGVLGRRPGLRGLRVPAIPGQRGVPQLLEIPDLPEGWSIEMPDPDFSEFTVPNHDREFWHDLRENQAEHLRSLRERIHQFEEGGWQDLAEPWGGRQFRFRSGDLDGVFDFHFDGPGQGAEREVRVRYPASTPEEEREVLIREARRKYGEEAEVVFEGEGTSISIVTRSRSELPSAKWVEPDEILEEVIEEPVLRDAEVQATEVRAGWHDSLEQALAAARKSGKPVLIDFSAEWCGPCLQLGSQLLHNPEHAALIARFEPVQIDVDEDGGLAQEFEVGGIPDLRVLRPSGEQVHKVVGFGGVDAAIRQLEIGLEKASAEGPSENPRVEKLKEHREELRRELEVARRRLEELRQEIGGGESSSQG